MIITNPPARPRRTATCRLTRACHRLSIVVHRQWCQQPTILSTSTESTTVLPVNNSLRHTVWASAPALASSTTALGLSASRTRLHCSKLVTSTPARLLCRLGTGTTSQTTATVAPLLSRMVGSCPVRRARRLSGRCRLRLVWTMVRMSSWRAAPVIVPGTRGAGTSRPHALIRATAPIGQSAARARHVFLDAGARRYATNMVTNKSFVCWFCLVHDDEGYKMD